MPIIFKKQPNIRIFSDKIEYYAIPITHQILSGNRCPTVLMYVVFFGKNNRYAHLTRAKSILYGNFSFFGYTRIARSNAPVRFGATSKA